MTDHRKEIEEIERTGGARLPHRDADPIMRLYAHYFEPADFMLKQFQKIDAMSQGPKGLSRSKVIERRYYLMFWLSSLYVVLEGMERMPIDKELESRPLEIPQLAPRVIQILSDFDEHRDALRLLRNAQSHYQTIPAKHLQFFDERFRIAWAEGLHGAISRLLSDYRVHCAVVCAFAGRRSEIDMKRKYLHPSRHHSFRTSRG